MRTLIALTLAGEALADSCYTRTYSDAHLADNPQQVVRHISVQFHDGPERFASVIARFRDEDHTYLQEFRCYDPDDDRERGALLDCGIDCDGGTMLVWPKPGDAILLDTYGFGVGATCGEDGDKTRSVRDLGAEKT